MTYISIVSARRFTIIVNGGHQ